MRYFSADDTARPVQCSNATLWVTHWHLIEFCCVWMNCKLPASCQPVRSESVQTARAKGAKDKTNHRLKITDLVSTQTEIWVFTERTDPAALFLEPCDYVWHFERNLWLFTFPAFHTHLPADRRSSGWQWLVVKFEHVLSVKAEVGSLSLVSSGKNNLSACFNSGDLREH